ncbi:MAG TPA: prolyl oligopeptidase family serine peptidase [Kofleriaceae bacterium]
METIFGKQIDDPARWLEDEAAPAVQAWMETQDQAARKILEAMPGRAAYAARLRELFYFDAISAPDHQGGRYFYTRKHVDKEKTVAYWKQGADGEERVLFDPNTWSTDGSVGLGSWSPSWDGRFVAYQVKENNSDEAVTRIFDLDAGADLPDRLEGTKYWGLSWAPDSRGFYFTWVPPIAGDVTIAARPGFAEVRLHRLGGATDETLYGPTGDPETFVGGGISRDGHWLTVTVQHGWSSSDVLLRRPEETEWRALVRGSDANYDAMIWRDTVYLRTNEGAPRYRVLAVDPAGSLARDTWRELVPESEATLEAANIVGEHLALTYLRNASSEMELRALDGTFVRAVQLPPFGASGGLGGNPDEDTAYFAYTSFTEPQVIYETSIATGAVREWARVELPVDTRDFVTEQVFFPSKDGTRVSMFLLYKRGMKRDGTAPCILYGYGGFSVSLTPSFASSRTIWLDRGGMYAIPNLRGGGEYGEDWHKHGMLLEKQNTFDDFIAAAEYLIAEHWTSTPHLAISGGSNGGLLVGAVAMQRPELVRAVVCSVPLLDMLRYQKFGSGMTWVPEYGSPDDEREFAALWAYSPYRVAVDAGKRAYPAFLFESADHDDRVDPMHARKLASVLAENQTSAAPILLRIERNAGHGGADMVAQTVERVADQLAFLANTL